MNKIDFDRRIDNINFYVEEAYSEKVNGDPERSLQNSMLALVKSVTLLTEIVQEKLLKDEADAERRNNERAKRH